MNKVVQGIGEVHTKGRARCGLAYKAVWGYAIVMPCQIWHSGEASVIVYDIHVICSKFLHS